MAWNDIFDETTDWSHVDFIGMFWAAYNERVEATGVVGGIGVPAVGDDISSAVFPGEYLTPGVWSISWLQLAIEAFAEDTGVFNHHGFFIRTDVEADKPAPVADSGDGFLWTLATLRAAAGLHSDGFRRKKPRERADEGATPGKDHDGNTLADGMVAYGRGGVAGVLGKRYHRQNGAWVACGTMAMDVLDSDAATPDHCAYGPMQPGDYIGPWIWNELRDVLNKLVWAHQPGRELDWVDSDGRTWETTAPQLSRGAAIADAEANEVSEILSSRPECSARLTSGGTTWSAYSHRSSQKLQVSNCPTFCNSKPAYWALTLPVDTFDAQSTSALDNEWVKFAEGAADDNATKTSSYFGPSGAGSFPNWPATVGEQGYCTVEFGAVVVLKYDVAGGFTYQP